MLGGRFHITLACPTTHDELNTWRAEIDLVCDEIATWQSPRKHWPEFARNLLGLFASVPVAVAKEHSMDVKRTISRIAASKFDLIVLDFPHTGSLLSMDPAIPTIVFTHNVESEIYDRYSSATKNPLIKTLWRTQEKKMRRFEGNVLKQCSSVIAVSERDRNKLESLYELADVRTIKTGVDLNYYQYRGNDHQNDSVNRIIFLGSMDWRPNVDAVNYFMNDIWHLISTERNDIEVQIIGRSPPQSLIDEVRRRNLPWYFSGFVQDVRPYVHNASVFIMPIRIGSGTRIKAFEAMAMGCPIVSTTLGVEGLNLKTPEHYLLGDTSEMFAAAVIKLLQDSSLRNTLAKRGRTLVETQYSSDDVAQSFEDICFLVAGRRRMQ